MIENYVHWNEDIGEWQLVSINLHPFMKYYGILPVDWSCTGYNAEKGGPEDESSEKPLKWIRCFNNYVITHRIFCVLYIVEMV